jgi:hypothetical protein
LDFGSCLVFEKNMYGFKREPMQEKNKIIPQKTGCSPSNPEAKDQPLDLGKDIATKEHGGTLCFESGEGEEAEFTLVLPITKAESKNAKVSSLQMLDLLMI